MILKKLISIVIGIFLYLTISNFFHYLYGGRWDISLGILYLYSDLQYIIGFVLIFLFYGENLFCKILFLFFSIILLSLYIYNWLIIYELPYERFLYIGLGLFVYIIEPAYSQFGGNPFVADKVMFHKSVFADIYPILV